MYRRHPGPVQAACGNLSHRQGVPFQQSERRHGNQVFEPNVQIIGHEFTRRMLLNNSIGMPLYRNYLTAMPAQIEDLRKRIASEADFAAKAKLQTQLQVAENNLASQKDLRPTPPNVTLTTQMTLYRGTREIQIRFLGRGHTAGDVVVFLPNEGSVHRQVEDRLLPGVSARCMDRGQRPEEAGRVGGGSRKTGGPDQTQGPSADSGSWCSTARRNAHL